MTEPHGSCGRALGEALTVGRAEWPRVFQDEWSPGGTSGHEEFTAGEGRPERSSENVSPRRNGAAPSALPQVAGPESPQSRAVSSGALGQGPSEGPWAAAWWHGLQVGAVRWHRADCFQG